MELKPFDELSDRELYDLDAATLERYIDLTSAEQGVALLPDLPSEGPPELPAADLTYYVLGGFEFLDKADALRVLDALQMTKSQGQTHVMGGDYRVPYRWAPGEPLGSRTITERKAYSSERAKVVADTASDIAAAREQFNTLQREHADIAAKRAVIRNTLRGKVLEVKAREGRRQRLREDFDRYLALAGGQRAVAGRFLLAAHKDAQDLCPELFETVADERQAPGVARAYAPDSV